MLPSARAMASAPRWTLSTELPRVTSTRIGLAIAVYSSRIAFPASVFACRQYSRRPMVTPAVCISHLRKVYRGGTVAVDDLSMTIAPGDFFGFLGPNGAGKSTTIHCMTGIAKPTSGKIEIFGVDAVKDYREARRLVGLSPQEFNVDTFAKVTQIIDWMGGYFGMRAAERKARTDMLIERFELGPHAKKQFRE